MPVKRKPAAAEGKDAPATKRPATAEGDAAPTKKAKRTGLYEEYKGSQIPEPRVARGPKVSGGFTAISWNVAGLRAFLAKRSAELQKLVRQENPAILGLLEHKLQEGQQVDDAKESLESLLPEYSAAFVSCAEEKKGYSGVLILYRKDLAPPITLRRMKLEQGPREGRTVMVELPKLFVVVCYVLNSGDSLQRLEERIDQWDPKMRQYLWDLALKKPVLLLGDLNVAHRDADIWNLEAPHVPKTAATTPQEREGFGKLLDAGFVDSFAHLHPEVMGAFTYWSVRAQNRTPNRGLRLDYAVVSKSIVDGKQGVSLVDAFHLPEFAPSGDHCPVGATLKLA